MTNLEAQKELFQERKLMSCSTRLLCATIQYSHVHSMLCWNQCCRAVNRKDLQVQIINDFVDI